MELDDFSTRVRGECSARQGGQASRLSRLESEWMIGGAIRTSRVWSGLGEASKTPPSAGQ